MILPIASFSRQSAHHSPHSRGGMGEFQPVGMGLCMPPLRRFSSLSEFCGEGGGLACVGGGGATARNPDPEGVLRVQSLRRGAVGSPAAAAVASNRASVAFKRNYGNRAYPPSPGGSWPPLSFSRPKQAILAPLKLVPGLTMPSGPPISRYLRHRGSWPPITFASPGFL